MINKEQMKQLFEKQTAILKNFGFKGEVLIKGGLVVIGAFDKHSSSIIRKGFKMAKNAGTGTLTEVRGKNGFAAFVWVDDSLVMSKKEIRELALAA